jgi:hypothetical protein
MRIRRCVSPTRHRALRRGVETAVQSLAALCEAHGLGQVVQVLEGWLAARTT